MKKKRSSLFDFHLSVSSCYRPTGHSFYRRNFIFGMWSCRDMRKKQFFWKFWLFPILISFFRFLVWVNFLFVACMSQILFEILNFWHIGSSIHGLKMKIFVYKKNISDFMAVFHFLRYFPVFLRPMIHSFRSKCMKCARKRN